MSISLPETEFSAIVDAVAYNAWPHAAKAVTARKGHPCVMETDSSWFRACHTIRPGERYVRVAVFWPWSRAPLTAAVCDACADGCSNLPDTHTPTPPRDEGDLMSENEIDVEGLRQMLDDAREAWLWHEAVDDRRAGYGCHMSQMLYRLPVDGQTRDMKASIEGLIDALAVALDEVEALRGQVERVEAVLDQWAGSHSSKHCFHTADIRAALDGPR